MTVELSERIASFIDAEQVMITRNVKGQAKEVDIRPDVISLSVIESDLQIKLTKGSPLRVAAELLGLDVEAVRRLGVRKTGITLKSAE